MNPAAAIAVAAGSIAIYVGLVARRFALAPGWGEQRWFGYIAFGADRRFVPMLGQEKPPTPSAVVTWKLVAFEFGLPFTSWHKMSASA